MSVPYIVWLLFSTTAFAFGEFFSKKFALSQSWVIFFTLMGCYMLSTLLWLPAIVEDNQLSIVGSIWSVLSLVVTVLIGTLIFHEHLNLLAIIGIALGAISVFLLSIA